MTKLPKSQAIVEVHATVHRLGVVALLIGEEWQFRLLHQLEHIITHIGAVLNHRIAIGNSEFNQFLVIGTPV